MSQRRASDRGGRSSGSVNDGSDFQYRMSVDERYKKAAQHRKLLEKLNASQAFYALASGLMSGALLGRPDESPSDADATGKEWWRAYTTATARFQHMSLLDMLHFYALMLAAVSSMIGYVAVQSNRPLSLRLQALTSAAAAALALWPFLNAAPIRAVSSEFEAATESGEYTWFAVILIQNLQDVIGLFVSLAVAFFAWSLSRTMIVKKDK